MVKLELNWSSGNVINRTDNCFHGYKISIATKITLASFCHYLAKYELHICNDILFIYNIAVKMPPFYPTNLAFKQNLISLNNGYCQMGYILIEIVFWGLVRNSNFSAAQT